MDFKKRSKIVWSAPTVLNDFTYLIDDEYRFVTDFHDLPLLIRSSCNFHDCNFLMIDRELLQSENSSSISKMLLIVDAYLMLTIIHRSKVIFCWVVWDIGCREGSFENRIDATVDCDSKSCHGTLMSNPDLKTFCRSHFYATVIYAAKKVLTNLWAHFLQSVNSCVL